MKRQDTQVAFWVLSTVANEVFLAKRVALRQAQRVASTPSGAPRRSDASPRRSSASPRFRAGRLDEATFRLDSERVASTKRRVATIASGSPRRSDVSPRFRAGRFDEATRGHNSERGASTKQRVASTPSGSPRRSDVSPRFRAGCLDEATFRLDSERGASTKRRFAAIPKKRVRSPTERLRSRRLGHAERDLGVLTFFPRGLMQPSPHTRRKTGERGPLSNSALRGLRSSRAPSLRDGAPLCSERCGRRRRLKARARRRAPPRPLGP